MPNEYWLDRLTKLKYAGLNTVELYVSWNLHEPYSGEFNFSGDLDVVRFIEMAGELGLHVLFRPGPYICAEWEWGGHPYWLLHDTDMKVRTTYPGYLEAVEKFYSELFGRVNHLMYRNGGPIIAVQIENEYAGFADALEIGPLDPGFLTWLRQTIKDQQCEELLFTSDGGWDFYKYELEGDPYGLNFDDVLRTVNFQTRADFWLNILENNQPGKPKMVMEWWSGWFDFWGYHHQGTTADSFEENLRAILSQNASVNYYMFHGGTNFGYMNGANFNTNDQTNDLEYQPVVTSYDYDCPLSEEGRITKKLDITRTVVQEILGFSVPDERPADPEIVVYETTLASEAGQLWRNLAQAESFATDKCIAMEWFPTNEGRGQPYGYALYRSQASFPKGNMTLDGMDKSLSGRANIFVNQERVYSITNTPGNQAIKESIPLEMSQWGNVVDILVENSGRINYKKLNNAYMGLKEQVGFSGNFDASWNVWSLPFDQEYVESLKWDSSPVMFIDAPAFYKFDVYVDEPHDAFINMIKWGKGLVFINGRNLGRYFYIGPQQTLYIPKTFWNRRDYNTVVVFEEIQAPDDREIEFSATPILDVNQEEWPQPETD